MTIDELQYLECTLHDHVSYVFDQMQDAGTTEWDLRKMELINRILSELDNITIEL